MQWDCVSLSSALKTKVDRSMHEGNLTTSAANGSSVSLETVNNQWDLWIVLDNQFRFDARISKTREQVNIIVGLIRRSSILWTVTPFHYYSSHW